MTAYYNEWEPYPAQWLRNLIAAKLIAPGDVDERSIKDVKADDLRKYTQCHFFAGIGGWSYALRLAGWPDERPVWTGSCPCQPFSSAGKKTLQSDERHLWPHWFRLISESKPSTIFGEQVARAINHGWLDDAFHDLETENYACAAAVLPALYGQKSHERQRVWLVAHTQNSNDYGGTGEISRKNESEAASGQKKRISKLSCPDQMDRSILLDASCGGNPSWLESPDGLLREMPPESGSDLLAYGIPNQLDKECALGNAIVATCGAEFIEAYMQVRP